MPFPIIAGIVKGAIAVGGWIASNPVSIAVAMEGVKAVAGIKKSRDEAGIAEKNAKKVYEAGVKTARLKKIQAGLQRASLERQLDYNRKAFKDYNIALQDEYRSNLDKISDNFARNGVNVKSNASMMVQSRLRTAFEQRSRIARRTFNEKKAELINKVETDADFMEQASKIDTENTDFEIKNTLEAISQRRNLGTVGAISNAVGNMATSYLNYGEGLFSEKGRTAKA